MLGLYLRENVALEKYIFNTFDSQDNVFPGFSLIAMAVGSLTASILAFLLPETLNEPQPETPEDLKKMMGQKRRLLPTKTVQR